MEQEKTEGSEAEKLKRAARGMVRPKGRRVGGAYARGTNKWTLGLVAVGLVGFENIADADKENAK